MNVNPGPFSNRKLIRATQFPLKKTSQFTLLFLSIIKGPLSSNALAGCQVPIFGSHSCFLHLFHKTSYFLGSFFVFRSPSDVKQKKQKTRNNTQITEQ